MPDYDRKIRVALVDDHTAFRDAVRAALSAQPDLEIVAELGSGHGVLELLSNRKPDILLLDLMMPGLDGFATLKQIRDLRHDVRIIVLSESQDEAMRFLVVKLGASGYVAKSEDAGFLVDGIRSVHRGGTWIDGKTVKTMMLEIAERDPRQTLAKREEKVIELLCQGHTNRRIGEQLSVSEKAVKHVLTSIFKKVGVSNRVELVQHATRRLPHLLSAS